MKNVPEIGENYKPASGEDVDLVAMHRLVAEVAEELELDAKRAVAGLQKDKEIWDRLHALRRKEGDEEKKINIGGWQWRRTMMWIRSMAYGIWHMEYGGGGGGSLMIEKKNCIVDLTLETLLLQMKGSQAMQKTNHPISMSAKPNKSREPASPRGSSKRQVHKTLIIK